MSTTSPNLFVMINSLLPSSLWTTSNRKAPPSVYEPPLAFQY